MMRPRLESWTRTNGPTRFRNEPSDPSIHGTSARLRSSRYSRPDHEPRLGTGRRIARPGVRLRPRLRSRSSALQAERSRRPSAQTLHSPSPSNPPSHQTISGSLAIRRRPIPGIPVGLTLFSACPYH
jgi:hypothetical protein